MAGSVNKIILVGNVGADPEIRHMQDASKVANFSLATNESWKDKKTGERKKKTEWHRIVIWNQHLVGIVEQYVKKGSKLYVEGQLQTHKWQGNDGVEKYTTEVVLNMRGELTMLDSRGEGGGDYQAPPPAGGPEEYGTDSSAGAGDAPLGGPQGGDLDDEIPF